MAWNRRDHSGLFLEFSRNLGRWQTARCLLLLVVRGNWRHSLSSLVSFDLIVLWRPICSGCKLKRRHVLLMVWYKRLALGCRPSSFSTLVLVSTYLSHISLHCVVSKPNNYKSSQLWSSVVMLKSQSSAIHLVYVWHFGLWIRWDKDPIRGLLICCRGKQTVRSAQCLRYYCKYINGQPCNQKLSDDDTRSHEIVVMTFAPLNKCPICKSLTCPVV